VVRRYLTALLVAVAALSVVTAAPASAADRVVTDYQDPLTALPPVSRPPTQHCAVTAMQHVFANSYGQPYVGTLTPPAEFRRFLASETKKWSLVAQRGGIQAE